MLGMTELRDDGVGQPAGGGRVGVVVGRDALEAEVRVHDGEPLGGDLNLVEQVAVYARPVHAEVRRHEDARAPRSSARRAVCRKTSAVYWMAHSGR